MTCDECDRDDAAPARVRFTPEKSVDLRLCPNCLEKFRESALVDEVVALEAD